jgi:ribosomal protein S12 methylthiotransferase accessory factor
MTAAPLPLRELVDPRVGILRSCARVAKDWREPPVPIVFGAVLSHFDFRRAPCERATSGKGLTESDAERGAIVEALERYCAAQRRPGSLVSGAASSRAPAIEPGELVLYSERQYRSSGFRYRRPCARSELTWVRGTRLDSGEEVLVPAALVYLNFVGMGGSEFLTATTTSGLAGGTDLPAAVLRGLYELVERDAFVITWLARLPVPRIDVSAATGVAAEIGRSYARVGIETLAFDLTNDLELPVVMALAIARDGSLPAAAVGLGCDLDPAVAIDRAFMEVVQVRTGLVPRFRQAPAPIARHEEVRTLEDHATFAANPDNLHELDFLLAPGTPRSMGDLVDLSQGSVEANLSHCRERLEAAGCTVAFVDLTLPDLEPFGIRIVRAIATGLQPIHFGFGEERLGGRRPYTVPRLLGYVNRELTEADLNPCPHPLA